MSSYTYNCGEFPGMGSCPASFTTETRDELWMHVEAHGAAAHGENPAEWSNEDRQQINAIIARLSSV